MAFEGLGYMAVPMKERREDLCTPVLPVWKERGGRVAAAYVDKEGPGCLCKQGFVLASPLQGEDIFLPGFG